jgi:hypothetical protein
MFLEWLPMVIPCGMAAVPTGLLIWVLILVRRERKLGEWPTQYGHRCVRCDYLLVKLTEPRCPECGLPFDPRQVDMGRGDSVDNLV